MRDLLLLVGDVPEELLSHLHDMLALDYSIEKALIGFQGLKQAKELDPQLVIIYNSVPGSEGIRLCNELKADDETGLIPLLLLYGRGIRKEILPKSVSWLVLLPRLILRNVLKKNSTNPPKRLLIQGFRWSHAGNYLPGPTARSNKVESSINN